MKQRSFYIKKPPLSRCKLRGIILIRAKEPLPHHPPSWKSSGFSSRPRHHLVANREISTLEGNPRFFPPPEGRYIQQVVLLEVVYIVGCILRLQSFLFFLREANKRSKLSSPNSINPFDSRRVQINGRLIC